MSKKKSDTDNKSKQTLGGVIDEAMNSAMGTVEKMTTPMKKCAKNVKEKLKEEDFNPVVIEVNKKKKKDKKPLEILVKYLDPDMEELEFIEGSKSDWIDLRSYEDVEMKKGEFKLINLGVCMKLPEGYEAHVVPRSSTFKKYGIIEVNSTGIIDNSYSGDDDVWFMAAYATRATKISKGDRICQFRIIKKQPAIKITKVDKMEGPNRGGHGSTGTK